MRARTDPKSRLAFLDSIGTAAVAVPGVVIGIGYLRAFYGIDVGGGDAGVGEIRGHQLSVEPRRLAA